ncbi:bacteriohemerythrin [uncultured Draconibacterium sp.]|uniref:bacteriohemerythrin n=1 Tax=uncultured Draconibacterium sp. TaxID=1573823 RepID=UPI0032605EAE
MPVEGDDLTTHSSRQPHIDIFLWDENFKTGVKEIDQQHKHLVFLLNQVANHIIFEQQEASLGNIINELVDYAVYHFQSEENYWLEVAPEAPETTSHRDSHNRFVERVQAFKLKSDTMPAELWLEELLSFLASWLAAHILESDKHMALLVSAVLQGKSVEEASLWADQQMQESTKAIINIIIASYKNLSASALRLMREIKVGSLTQTKLSNSEMRLQQAMEYAQIGYWSLAYNSEVADWSPEVFSLFGLPEDAEPSPNSLCRIMNEEYHIPFLNSMQECFQTGKEHYTEYPITRPSDGIKRWIECRGKVTYHDDGTPDRIAGFVQDITQRKDSERQITELAHFDSLTGLPNRRLLFDRLRQTIAGGKRSNQSNALLFLDIDDFKKINDQHGHDYGDALLKEVASRIRLCIRDGDTLARFAGDEFVVIILGLDSNQMNAAAQAEVVAVKLSGALAEIYQLKGIQYKSSVSIGIVVFGNGEQNESNLLKQADIAMYKAKQRGKNAVCFFDPQMQDEVNEKAQLEDDLRKAIQAQEFVLHYQPQLNQQSSVCGAESLVRWQHPNKGLIGPDRFIPLAEKTGLIIPLGEWVLKSACRQLSLWQSKAETEHLTLSVNVSARQFHDSQFIPLACQLLEKYSLPRGKLRLELTETMMVDDIDKTIASMNILRKKGVHFSLDDFGTGYSSLRYLKRLPLSQLKIDRSFVDDLESDVNDQAIIKTIISMSKALGLYTIAEGVETKRQRAFLENEGCMVYQGFLYSKPLPIEAFEMFLAK